MTSENRWLFFQHPDTLAVQRIRSDDEAYIKMLLKYTWEEIEKPDDWVKP